MTDLKKEAASAKAAEEANNIDPNAHYNDDQDRLPTQFDIELECLRQMRANVVPFEGPISFDGEIHRFSIDQKQFKKDEWYVARIWDFQGKFYAVCNYGSWSEGTKFVFQSWDEQSNSLRSCDIELLRINKAKMLKKAEEEQARRQKEAAIEAKAIWERASKEPLSANHMAYLQCKKTQLHIARFGRNAQGYEALIIPVCNADGDLRSLQFISMDEKGSCYKSFLRGGEKKGCFAVLGNLSNAGSFYVAEGYATASTIYEAKNEAVVVAFDCGNLDPVLQSLRDKYPNARITIAGDDDVDKPQNPGRQAAEQVGRKYHCNVIFPKFPPGYKLPNDESGTDFNDIHVHFGLAEAKRQLLKKTHLKPINIKEILAREIPPKAFVLRPWLREKDLSMIYAIRGLGKTWFALALAYAIASGGRVFNFVAERPRRILYLDGEMPASTIKERLESISKYSDVPIQNADNLKIINRDLEENPIRDLGTKGGQFYINEHLDDFDVLIIDNLSSLVQAGDENEAGSWVVMQEWILQLRKLGKTVLMIHHAGKNGQQRGTSKREDVLDTVIALKKPKNWCASDGARFEIHFEKNRCFEGTDAKPFEVHLVLDKDGIPKWEVKDIETNDRSEAFALRDQGLSITDISKELGVNKSTVSRWFRQ